MRFNLIHLCFNYEHQEIKAKANVSHDDGFIARDFSLLKALINDISRNTYHSTESGFDSTPKCIWSRNIY